MRPAEGDNPAYLAGAYELFHDHRYAMRMAPTPVRPELGREPGYPLFLAGLMTIDPAFRRLSPLCVTRDDACPKRWFRAPAEANFALILATAALLFVAGRRLTGRVAGGLVAAGYVLANTHMNKGWAEPMSDRLALCLVALCLVVLLGAFRERSAWRWMLVGASVAALVLTKAIFAPLGVALALAACIVALCPGRDRATRAGLLAGVLLFALPVGLWVARNHAVSGEARLTDARSGIALSTRAVFDEMSPREYAASLVFWSGSAGAHLATRLFGHATADRFRLDAPGGYYDVGQNSYVPRVAGVERARGVGHWRAVAIVDRDIVAGLWRDRWGYLASMLPLTYRGLWVDEFVWLGLPVFAWVLVRAARRRDWALLIVLLVGAYNMLAYAAVSLNIERYQLTAMPSVALAVAVAAAGRTGIGWKGWRRQPS